MALLAGCGGDALCAQLWTGNDGVLFRFTIIWESIIVIIGEKRAEVTEIIWELIRPKVV